MVVVSFHDRVTAHADRLTPADRRLLEILLSYPTESAFLPASEVADRAGVHQGSATKLAQKLGYVGYPDLRRDLQVDLLEGASPADRVQRRVELAGDGSILDALVADEISALQDLPRQVPQEQLDEAARLLLGARHRLLFARGNASVLADLLARRLSRFGLPSSLLAASGRGLAEQVVGLGAGDVVVAFALLRMPHHLPELAQQCRDVGARLVVVTDTLAGELEASADVLLRGARGSGREFQSLTVPMAITNALVLSIARAEPARTGDALSRLEKLLATFDR